MSGKPWIVNTHSYVLLVGMHSMNMVSHSHLSGITVSVLAAGPKGHQFTRGRVSGFLTVIKIRSTPFFGWEVKLEAACH
jgi:hypothetical protein